MTFRIEEKLFIKNESIVDFKEFINTKFTKKNFNPRIIESVYFENSKLEMHRDSIEGLTPRKKIRIRHYPTQKDAKFYLETKVSSVEGRFKKRKLIDIQKFENLKKIGIFDLQYGLCHPNLTIRYMREYFQIDDIRITIDNNITYKFYLNEFIYKDLDTIVEIKTSIKKNLDDLLKSFPFQKIRLSKYCNGIVKFRN